jgi:hypothetical protein
VTVVLFALFEVLSMQGSFLSEHFFHSRAFFVTRLARKAKDENKAETFQLFRGQKKYK